MNYKELTAMKSMITNRMNAVTTDIAWETQGVAPPMLNYISYKGTTKTIIDLVDEEVMRAILELMPDLERIVDRAYNDGYDHGCAVGERDGFYKGHTEGQEDGSQYSYGEGYDAGYNTGGKEGYDEGHSEGYDAGYNTGRKEGFDEGHDEGYWKGEREGYEKGYLARIESIQRPKGYEKGYPTRIESIQRPTEDELLDMRNAAYESGWDDGFADGKDDGRKEGYQAKGNQSK